ncbi:MAG TPA: matrixin family metalloprotease, partial [Gemmataceae bacterium]|nr:matrixin family metalloprotease [Gemmataceae bacterium]
MVRRIPLRCQELESRDVPATFGTPWPDGQQLSLSFAPDNTSIAGYSSDLSDLGSAAIMQMLTAFQTWAMQANLNVGLVADDGSRFGIGGPVQGDPRFGDIRIGGLPLLADVLAITAPYNLYDNYSGDVVVNTAAYGSSGPDLYTVILQEAGHALSVGNSSDPSSVMYEFYQGPRSGLAAGDVASIRGLYGARPADAFEGTTGNST